ncbi:hypothetical protein GCM10027431_05900 [Lysobacter rhizosphaerae]
MVAPSAPRDARSKTPPGPEGSNGIDRRGCRGQPAGSSPVLGSARKRPRIRFANPGSRYVLPIPAASPRPLTKGAVHQNDFRSGLVAARTLRVEILGLLCKSGSRYVLPIPAASPRPLTKGAVHQSDFHSGLVAARTLRTEIQDSLRKSRFLIKGALQQRDFRLGRYGSGCSQPASPSR